MNGDARQALFPTAPDKVGSAPAQAWRNGLPFVTDRALLRSRRSKNE
jgi:hypothetical protein